MPQISYAVIVARCQVPFLHEGHHTLFREVSGRHDKTLLFLGTKTIGATPRNPLDFETRKAMVLEAYPDFIILPQKDMADDSEWSKTLDQNIKDIVQDNPVTLYGSRDSFIPRYEGGYPTTELLDLPSVDNPELSGTHIRFLAAKQVRNSEDFRAGVIYAMSNLYPSVKATVDIVITHTPLWSEDVYFLLGRKPNETKWRFIGGFSEPTTPSFEFDAIREVKEETGLDISEVTYIGSTLIPDWRWSKEPDQVKTLVFTAESSSMNAVASDDIEEVKWFLSDQVKEDQVIPAHKGILSMIGKVFT